MPYQPLEEPAILLPAAVPGLKMVPRIVLRAVDRFTGVAPTFEVVVEPSEQSQELRFIVERSDNLMAAFVPIRILSILTYNPAMDGVVVGVHVGHIVSVRRRSAEWERQRPDQGSRNTSGTTNVVVWYDPTTKDIITVTFIDGAVTGKNAAGL